MEEVASTSEDTYNDTYNDTYTYTYLNESQPYQPYYERPETYIVPALFAIIFVVGVAGNGTLVAVFVRHKAMRNVPNTYILSLALADLLVIVTCVPFTSLVYTVESWPWGELVCRVSEAGKDVSVGVSVFTLTALSADRYFAIVDPLRKMHATGGSRRATRVTVAAAVGIWVLAGAMAAPAYFGSYLRGFTVNAETQFYACYPYPAAWGARYPRAAVLARFVLYYALPLAVVGVFYVLMARHLVLSARNVPGELQGTQRQMRARRKVAVTVLAFVLVFAACFLPSHVFMMWFYWCDTSQEDYNGWWHALRIAGFCLSFLNSCVNPIALYCTSGIFRKHFNSDTSQEDYNGSWHALRIAGFCLSFLNSCVNAIALYCTSGIFRKHFNRYLLCRAAPGTRGSVSLSTSRRTMHSSRKTNISMVPRNTSVIGQSQSSSIRLMDSGSSKL